MTTPSPTTAPSIAPQVATPPVMLTVTTDASGRITSGSGHWPHGGPYRATTLGELVQKRNHDLLERIVRWVGTTGRLDSGVAVQIRTAEGWDQAIVTAAARPDGIQWCFVPTLADPLRATVRAITGGRDLSVALDAALCVFDDTVDEVWASVHYDRSAGGRYNRIATAAGRDTFRRAVEGAVAGDVPQPWDASDLDDGDCFDLADFGDGINLAGPHAGLAVCRMTPVPSVIQGDVACIAVWSETVGRLEAPELHLLVQRVAAAVTLVFQMQEGIDAQRILATRDALTGMWNRQAMFAELSELDGRRPCAIISADLTRFRAVNEAFGHTAGDAVLAELAERLRKAMRPGDMVARMSADEFALVCFDVTAPEVARAIAERMLATCEQPFRVGGVNADLQLNLGVALTVDGQPGVGQYAAAEQARAGVKATAPGTWALAPSLP